MPKDGKTISKTEITSRGKISLEEEMSLRLVSADLYTAWVMT